MLNLDYQQLAANSIAHAAEMANENIRAAASRYEAPSVLFRPSCSLMEIGGVPCMETICKTA